MCVCYCLKIKNECIFLFQKPQNLICFQYAHMSYRQSIHFSFCSHGSPSFSDGDVVVVGDQVDAYVESSSVSCLGESNKQFH